MYLKRGGNVLYFVLIIKVQKQFIKHEIKKKTVEKFTEKNVLHKIFKKNSATILIHLIFHNQVHRQDWRHR